MPPLLGIVMHRVYPDRRMRCIQRDEPVRLIGKPDTDPPPDRGAPIVPGYREFLASDVLCEADNVGREQIEVVCRDPMWPVTQIVAALIRHQDAATGIHQVSIWCRQPYQNSGNPCSSTIKGPFSGPASATCRLTPLYRPPEGMIDRWGFLGGRLMIFREPVLQEKPMPAAVGCAGIRDAKRVRAAARDAEDADQARRLPAIAAGCEGRDRTTAAKIGAMDPQRLLDWVRRFNAAGVEGLIERKPAGAARRLTALNRVSGALPPSCRR